ncbi:MAG: hypothetical protein ACRDTD_30730, partial [Pseudonocardiaceae bacterium]
MQTRTFESRAAIGFLLCTVALLHGSSAVSQSPPAAKTIEVARFTSDGKLLKPADLAQWVFLGTSLGMGYNQGTFNPASPGQFQVVLMEPGAYRYFMENGRFAPGSMFLLNFFDSDQRRSINQVGYVQADLNSFEIHLIDAR